MNCTVEIDGTGLPRDGERKSELLQNSDNFEEQSFWEEDIDEANNEDKNCTTFLPRKSTAKDTNGSPEASDRRTAQKRSKSQTRVKKREYSDKSAIESHVQAIRMREIHRKMAESARERLRKRKQGRVTKNLYTSPSPADDEVQSAIDRARFVDDVEGITKQLREINSRLDKRYTDVLCKGDKKHES